MRAVGAVVALFAVLGHSLSVLPSKSSISLHKMVGRDAASYWLDDKSVAFNFSQPDDFTNAVSVKASPGSPANVLYIGSGPLPEGGSSWRLKIQERSKQSHVSLGVTDKYNLGAGYKTRGAMFNGLNLTNGIALLVGDYGFSSDFDELFMHVVLQTDGLSGERHLKMWYSMNGLPLGLAFNISSEGQHLPLEMFPVVAIQGDVKLTLTQVMEQPASKFYNRADLYASTHDPVLGMWRVLKENADLNLTDNLVIRIKSGVGSNTSDEEVAYTVSWKVVNVSNMLLKCAAVGVGESQEAERTCKGGYVVSTRMMGEPGQMQQESRTAQFFESLKTVQVSVCAANEGNDALLLDGGSMELTREFPNIDAVVESPMKAPQESVTV